MKQSEIKGKYCGSETVVPLMPYAQGVCPANLGSDDRSWCSRTVSHLAVQCPLRGSQAPGR